MSRVLCALSDKATPMRLTSLFSFGFFLLSGLSLFGQHPAGAPPKAVKLFEKAEAALKAQDPDQAIRFLKDALVVAPDYYDAWVDLGHLHRERREWEATVACYEKALRLDSLYRPAIWYQTALALREMGRFEEAIPKLETYLAQNPKNERQKAFAVQLLEQTRFAAQAVKNPVPFQPQPLHSFINTPLPEYLPSLSADGQLLVFTRVVNGQEDFYFSFRSPETNDWQPPQPLEELNTPVNEGAHCLSADGRVLVFTACNQRDGLGSCDLYISTWSKGEWSPPRNLRAPVNSPGYETQPTLSANGNTLLFASTRPGGFGGNDLWQSDRLPDGRWSTPRNLGPVINTAEDDQAPFLHPDGRTLYFMSKGHPGMGGFDLFFSRKSDAGEWEKPQNLGYPINTLDNEGALIVSADGKKALFTKDQKQAEPKGRPVTDIYEFDLYAEARPTPVTYVRGVVKDAVTKTPVQATVQIASVEGGLREDSLSTWEDGSFFICLPLGENYAFTVEKKGYLFFSENYELREQREAGAPYEVEILLYPAPAVASPPGDQGPSSPPVVLRNVFFATGSAELRPASTAELDRLFRLLESNPAMRIELHGHTDDVGAEADNLDLSTRRAKAVYGYLIEKGIAPARLSYRGFGESMPLAPNTTPENRQRNRRTEFVVR